MKTLTKRILAAAVLLACGLLFLICMRLFSRSGDPGIFKRTGFYFDTVIEITLYDSADLSKEKAEGLLDECMRMCAHYEDLFSRTKEGSDVFRINHANGEEVTVDPETVRLLTDAVSYAEMSGGLADPTIGTLSALWFPDGPASEIPEEKSIEEACGHINFRNIRIENDKVALSDPRSAVDLGFIAKGYIADRLAEHLKDNGVKSALINLGGNVLAIGRKPDGSDFKVGIRDPLHPEGPPVMAIPAAGLSIVSSGNYERFFEKDGIRYHHILDTASGYPARTGLSQVTIIASSSEEADALSTICFLMGYDKAASFLNEHYPDVRAVFLDEKGRELSPPP